MNSVKLVNTFKLFHGSKTIDHEISVSAAKEFTQLKNVDFIRPSHWLLVEHEEESFLGIILKVSCTRAHDQCLEKPYGISETQDFEKAHISAWYPWTSFMRHLLFQTLFRLNRVGKMFTKSYSSTVTVCVISMKYFCKITVLQLNRLISYCLFLIDYFLVRLMLSQSFQIRISANSWRM